FISLDLAIPWSSTAPAWKKLAHAPSKQYDYPASFSSDEQTLFVFQYQKTTQPFSYNVEADQWQLMLESVPNLSIGGIGAVTDPNTGLIYLAGGHSNGGRHVAPMDTVDIFDPVTYTTHSDELPIFSETFSLHQKYGNVWSKHLNSVLYWGGLIAPGDALGNPVMNQVTQLLTGSMIWSTM
ncbi:hypothetical protein BGZ95_005519, partial [Linnemannia exigua]